MNPLQWAVILANLNPAVGTEQKGKRPVLIVSNEDYNQIVPNVTVLPLTSTGAGYIPLKCCCRKEKQDNPWNLLSWLIR